MLARSALIARWYANQVPWDPLRELHRVPARSSNQSRPHGIDRGNCNESGPQGIAAGPAPVDRSMALQPSPLGSMVVHTFNQCLPYSLKQSTRATPPRSAQKPMIFLGFKAFRGIERKKVSPQNFTGPSKLVFVFRCQWELSTTNTHFLFCAPLFVFFEFKRYGGLRIYE